MPLTGQEYNRSLGQPPLCEQLKVRDITDDLFIQMNGSFVAGYTVSGINSYYASDEERNRTKFALEALVRSLPERSMRMQARFEISEKVGDLLGRYNREQRNPSPVLRALDRQQADAWSQKDADGFYLRHFLHFYFNWDPRIHHQSSELKWKKKMRGSSLSMSATKCIERGRREHEDLVAEFRSLMSGVEATLQSTGMTLSRMSGDDLFLEIKRALHPLGNDRAPYRRSDTSVTYESARSQIANVNIEDELDEYLKIGGLLYSFISLKDLPDATFPGVLRELVVIDFPIVITAEIILPDQAKSVKQYKSRLRKMTAAQKDIHGGFRLNVDAQVAEHQLIKVLQDLIASSLKSCQMSLTVAIRTSRPACNRMETEQAERILADRRQRGLHAIGRMNGARGIPETLAQKRLFFASLPAMAGENKRELECLTLHAADLLPAELPWQGLSSAGILLETPSRQMVPFSPFDPSLGDANMLIMAKSGGGKTFMAQLLLLMLGRTGVEISILERGDSYRPLVELMGGRVIEVNLDGNETLNPWDLPEGEKTPSKEKIAFLKNLTRHMIGDAPGSDTTLVDNVISEAIGRTYKRVGLRYANPVPTFSDLRDELAQWQDEEKMQRAIDEAKLAAIKLRTWTDKGIYSRLFDRHTNIRTDNNWLFFNVEGLGSDPHLETAMSMLIANAMAERASGR